MTEPYITVTTGESLRVKVSRWDAPSGHALVSIAPEYRDRWGNWKLAHSGVSIPPACAGEVAAAITMTAAVIDGSPPEPMPTEEDREESRMP